LFAASFSVVAQPSFASALSNGAETALPRSADSKDTAGAMIVAQAYDSFRPKPDRSEKPDRPPKLDRGAAGMQDYHTPRGAIEADRPARRERGAAGPSNSRLGKAMEGKPIKDPTNPPPKRSQRGLGQALPVDQGRPIGPRGPGGPNRSGTIGPMPQGISVPTDQPR